MKTRRMKEMKEFLKDFNVVVLGASLSRGYALMIREDSGISIARVSRCFPGICSRVENVGGVMQVFFY